jgi:hypothetical protein
LIGRPNRGSVEIVEVTIVVVKVGAVETVVGTEVIGETVVGIEASAEDSDFTIVVGVEVVVDRRVDRRVDLLVLEDLDRDCCLFTIVGN